ncbi:MAG: AAA family ATPase, partial [Desulfomonilaceae bacterium]
MQCHCKDHLPGDWHSHEDCDCNQNGHPTYSFVVTKVIDDFPGTGAVFISKTYMQNLGLSDGDAVEILGPSGCVVQAKSHPNSWIDTRMVSFDKDTMEKTGFQMFSQVKLRKAVCVDAETLTLQAPAGVDLTRQQIRSMLDKVGGVVLASSDFITLETNRGETIRFRIMETEPDEICRISPGTRIKLVDEHGQDYVSSKDTYFADVGGLHEAVRKVREVVQLPLKHPEIFYRLGIDPPRGVLLHGPSGTGKTLIARAVAAETGCWFKSVVGSEIMEKHYGESEAKLRAAFEDAYKHAPAIIFIDEIDALAPRRDTSEGEVERRVTAQLLALMDGLEDRGAVMVLAATNLPNNLDPALRRPGRFDREITIGTPDAIGRREIIEIHSRSMPLGEVNLDDLADRTHGFVGADIKSLCQEAAYEALRRSLPGLEDTDQQLSADFLEALTVDSCDFESALKNMRPSAGRRFEVN